MQTGDAGHASNVCRLAVFSTLIGAAWLIQCTDAVSAPAAAEYDLEIGAGLQYTDNVDRTADDRRTEWILSPTIAAFLDTETPTLRADLSGRLAYLDYLRGTNSNTISGTLSLVSAWEPLQERLVLHLQNQYREVPADQRGPLTPENRERVNSVLVGPDLILRPSPVDRLVFGVRAGHAYFEESLNNTRLVGVARWEHAFSPRTDAYLEASTQDVHFQGDGGSDFIRQDAETGVVYQFPSSELRLAAGMFRVDRDQRSDVDGYQAELGWDFELNRLWSLDVTAGRHTFDAGSRLLETGVEALTLGTVNAGFDDDLVTTNQAGLTIRRDAARQQFFLAGSYAEESFEDTNRDRDIAVGRAGVSLRLTSGLTAGVSGWYAEYRFDEDGRRDEETSINVTLRQQIDRNYFTELGYTYMNRSSTDDGEGFRENSILLVFGYAFRP